MDSIVTIVWKQSKVYDMEGKKLQSLTMHLNKLQLPTSKISSDNICSFWFHNYEQIKIQIQNTSRNTRG